MKRPIPAELLEKYLNGTCSDEEAALVQHWYASFDDLPDDTATLNEEERKHLEQKIYDRILENICAPDEANVVQMPPRRGVWYKAAAAAIFAIAAAAFLMTKKAAGPQQTANAAVEQIIAVTNNSGHIYKAVLPDSSVVWLSPEAKLRYPKTFAKQARMVSMAGQCFFEVTKNPKRPFIITGSTIITKVWGTSFLVRDNGPGRSADVSVVTGKVSVSLKSKADKDLLSINKGEVMLYPRQKATYMAAANVLRPEATVVNDPQLKIWKHASLYFDNKPLKDIVPVLNSTYNAHIRMADEKMAQLQLNADLGGLNLPEVLEVLNKALGIDYAMSNNTIQLIKTN